MKPAGDVDGEGDVDGDVEGDVLGDVDGDVLGDVEGDVLGDVDGDVVGDVPPPPSHLNVHALVAMPDKPQLSTLDFAWNTLLMMNVITTKDVRMITMPVIVFFNADLAKDVIAVLPAETM